MSKTESKSTEHPLIEEVTPPGAALTETEGDLESMTPEPEMEAEGLPSAEAIELDEPIDPIESLEATTDVAETITSEPTNATPKPKKSKKSTASNSTPKAKKAKKAKRVKAKRSTWKENVGLVVVLVGAIGTLSFYGYLGLEMTLGSPTAVVGLLIPEGAPIETRQSTEGSTTTTFFADRAEQALVGEVEVTLAQGDTAVEAPVTAQRATANGSLNIRALPSTEGELIGALAEGEQIQVEAIASQKDGDWIRFTYQNQEAYVKAEFMTLSE